MGHKERTKPTMDSATVLRSCFKYRRNLKHLHGTFNHGEHSHVINYQGIKLLIQVAKHGKAFSAKE